jgi:hypothetical protein
MLSNCTNFRGIFFYKAYVLLVFLEGVIVNYHT